MIALSSLKRLGYQWKGHFLLMLLLLCAFPARAEASLKLFGSVETESENLQPFTKWTAMLTRETGHRRQMQDRCKEDNCLFLQWQRIISQAKNLTGLQKLNFVNREINRIPYIIDPQNWNKDDYWETPYEFFVYSGDCEDFAITKYLTLKQAGVPQEAMRIVVLQDLNLNEVHSVLTVTIDGQNYILDNQFPQVMTDRAIHHYQPIYSINERHWWRHAPD